MSYIDPWLLFFRTKTNTCRLDKQYPLASPYMGRAFKSQLLALEPRFLFDAAGLESVVKNGVPFNDSHDVYQPLDDLSNQRNWLEFFSLRDSTAHPLSPERIDPVVPSPLLDALSNLGETILERNADKAVRREIIFIDSSVFVKIEPIASSEES